MNTSHHSTECHCWQCRVNSGTTVDLQEYRGSKVDPTVCAHPADARSPCSGDDWLCDDCGAFVPSPSEEPVCEPGKWVL